MRGRAALALFLLDARAFFTPSFVVFSDEGVHYSRVATSATVPWSEIAAVGIGFEQPPNAPRIPTSITDAVSGFLSAKALEAMGVEDIRKVALEIYPVDPAVMARHKVLARLRREYESPRVDLPPVRWRRDAAADLRHRQAVENGAAGFGGRAGRGGPPALERWPVRGRQAPRSQTPAPAGVTHSRSRHGYGPHLPTPNLDGTSRLRMGLTYP